MLAQADKLDATMGAIEKGNKVGSEPMGLEAAVSGLQSALRVVEGGDRTTPEQAIEVYKLSDEAAKSQIAEWKRLKSGEIVEFNNGMEKAGFHPIEISAIEIGVEFLMTQ